MTNNILSLPINSYTELPTDISPLNTLFVLTNSYMVVSKQDARHESIKMLSSSGYLECIGVAAILESKQGAFVGAALAHITVGNDEEVTINEMLNSLQELDVSGQIRIVIVGGQYRDFPEPFHSGESLHTGVLNSLSNYKVTDLTFDDRYHHTVAIDMQNRNVFAWDVFEDDGTTYTYKTDIFEAVNIAMVEPLAKNNALQQCKKIRTIYDQVEETMKRQPALRIDWKNAINDIRSVLISEKEIIKSRIESGRTDWEPSNLDY